MVEAPDGAVGVAAPAAGVAGLPKEKPPAAGLSVVDSPAGFGAPKLKPPAAGAGVAAVA